MSRIAARLAVVLPLALAGAAPQESAPTPIPEAERPLQAVVDAFVTAFDAGDAAAVAALFTPDGRVTDEGGGTVQGRDAIEAEFAAAFAADPGGKVAVDVGSRRFLGPGAAVEEGTATITPGPAARDAGARPSSTRYTVLYVLRDGKWLQESVRDEPADGDESAARRLAELDWLIGEWVEESDQAVVATRWEMDEGKAFIVGTFSVQVRGEPAVKGTQRIGWDPARGQFRSWMFDSDGGFGEGTWNRAGGGWLVKSTGTRPDGRSTTASQLVVPEAPGRMRWLSMDRTLGGSVVPDLPEIVLVRKPPKPM